MSILLNQKEVDKLTEFVKGIKNDEENRIKALKKKIKPIIDEHKLSDEKLKDKTNLVDDVFTKS